MNYLEIHISSNSELQDILIALLCEINFDSFEQEDNLLKAFIVEDEYNEKELSNILSSFDIHNFTCKALENKNWNEEWEKNFPDTVVHDQIHVRASFHPRRENISCEIIIEPKMSFGTGNHPTTFQVMEAMLNLDLKDKSVIDIGSGTGILGILAEKMGAKEVLAFDYDEWCYTNMQENQTLNDTHMQIAQCDVLEDGALEKLVHDKKYDLIIANLNRNLLNATFPKIISLLKEDSILITSGYYTEDEHYIIKGVEDNLGLNKINTSVKNNWTVNVFK